MNLLREKHLSREKVWRIAYYDVLDVVATPWVSLRVL